MEVSLGCTVVFVFTIAIFVRIVEKIVYSLRGEPAPQHLWIDADDEQDQY